jgi:hypothetical protein
MSAPPPVAVRGSMVGRVKGILMQPKSEWQVIDGEPATVGSIYMGYILLLAAIPAICGAVWMARYAPGIAAEYAVVRYVSGLISPFVLALIIDALAPSFGGHKNQIQALKVAAYASTAVWVSGIFLLIPGLGMLSILGLYSLYLLYLGLPVLMKAPADRALGYTVVTIVAAFVLAIIVSYVTRAVFGGAFYPGYSGFNR